MHPAFQLSALDSLPPGLRRTAISAARKSTDAVVRLQSLLKSIDDRERQLAFLPVFYANLEPCDISTDAQLESHSVFSSGAVLRAASSIGLAGLMVLDLHRDRLAEYPMLCASFLLFTGGFGGSREAIALMSSTRGYRRIISRSWGVLLHTTDTRAFTLGFEALTMTLLGQMRVQSIDDANEILDGARGTMPDLALLVVGYLNGIRPDRRIADVSGDSRLYGGIIDFVASIDKYLTPAGWDRTKTFGSLSTALLLAGIVDSLSRMLVAFTLPNITTPSPPMLLGLQLLVEIILKAAGSPFIAELIQGGFLQAIGPLSLVNNELGAPLAALLYGGLSRSLLSYRILSLLKIAIPAAERSTLHSIRSPKLLEAWKEFSTLANQRIRALQTRGQSRKACDNAKCGKIGHKDIFRRCGGCLAFYYCSEHCQRMDWRNGGHYEFCNSLISWRISERLMVSIVSQPLGTRDRHFLQALVDYDYNAHKFDVVLPEQALFMVRRPGDPFVTVFDYSQRGPVNIKVLAANERFLLQLFGAHSEWRHDILRVSQSPGRIHLNLLMVSGRGSFEAFIVPMRTETSREYDILVRIARNISAHTPRSVVAERIRRAVPSSPVD
ncbi:hypothetical protein B0H16DRAFT_1859575 [Mycena metata]|uniref:MYND-type domain-containing protein n=1 Tax=Mycena metata TaxID=1033252 RepID=A0AAD7II40_9AGAR|nr:hypothetical protein B0H16DRAFT_1859575 [Mycena metata]